jgi:hypothetical protein
LKNGPNQWLGTEFVHQVIVGTLVECIIKTEFLVYEVLGQIHFDLWLKNKDYRKSGSLVAVYNYVIQAM